MLCDVVACLSAYLVLKKTYLQLGPALIVQATFLSVSVALPIPWNLVLCFLQNYPKK